MKKLLLLILFPLLSGILVCPTTASAQSGGPYVLEWSTIDSGGGTSSSGQYKLTGTIGQHDAEYSSGDRYELLGGFWSGEPMCIVEFADFTRFAELWLDEGEGLSADLDHNGAVDLSDLKLLIEDWLCPCPFNWPLR